METLATILLHPLFKWLNSRQVSSSLFQYSECHIYTSQAGNFGSGSYTGRSNVDQFQSPNSDSVWLCLYDLQCTPNPTLRQECKETRTNVVTFRFPIRGKYGKTAKYGHCSQRGT